MFGDFYIFLLVGCIPFFYWQQREEGRNLVGALITGFFLILWLLTNTVPISWDTPTIAVFCFTLWMIASMFWTNSRQSSKDIYTIVCCLVIFLVARRMTFDILMPILFVPGLVFAGVSLYYHNIVINKVEDQRLKWPIFGNSNHVGAFLLVPLFVGLWLSFNVSWMIFPFTVVIGIAIALNQCRGAQLGAIIGLLFVASMQVKWMVIAFPILFIAAMIIYRKRITSIAHRFAVLIAALFIIKKAPIAGHGLRTFRREYPNIIPELLENKFTKSIFTKDVRKDKRTSVIEQNSSHRIHNDMMEIVLELGLIGLFLFLLIFQSLSWDNYFFAGAIIAFSVHGFFFFPLREAHTAFPFFALLGAMATTNAIVMAINPIIAVTLIFIVARISYEIAVKILGLSYFQQYCKIGVLPNSEDKKKLEQKQFFINNAIKCDPYNNVYLTEGDFINALTNKELAFQYISRCMENTDGGKVRWGISDQYARALLRLGGFGVAKLALNYSLHICPGFQQSKDLLEQINNLERTKVA
ncbi:MAG: O-antigen ligase family protein [Clostridia bacterium]|jgi:O-antigen ligase